MILVFAALAACGGKKDDDGAPTCAQVVDHLLTVTKQQLAGHAGMEQKMRKQMIDHCETSVSPDARHCLINAKTLDALADCKQRYPSTGGSAK
jgi:small lipoprotein (TIGR04454 family)